MTSLFSFSSYTGSQSTKLTLPAIDGQEEKTNLEITVTPVTSAFYAGQPFSATITFRNTRTPSSAAIYPLTPNTADIIDTAASSARRLPSFHLASTSQSVLPRRRRQIGRDIEDVRLHINAEAGPSRVSTPFGPNSETPHPHSPGANPISRASGWPRSPQRDGPMNFRSPEGWAGSEHPDPSSQLPGHTRRARSLALGKGTMSPQELVWALGGHATPPPLPARRGGPIPSHHPHSRKISVTTAITSPTSVDPPLPSRPSLSRLSSSASDVGSKSMSTSTSASSLKDQMTTRSPRRSPRREPHSRMPSYHNSYGASSMGLNAPALLPPPTHPYIRDHLPPDGTMTVLWAYTQLVAHFHPSNTYIPPDPLLPLRSLLLHQPVGSGSLTADAKSARGGFSFGTGTIGNSTQPSLTGSLFGLAKDLMYGGRGGSLEEERKRVWNMKDLPVLETARSLLGVDIKLKESESQEFTYTLQLPSNLPPTFHGKAFRFSYDLVVSVNIALPGGRHKQKTKTVTVPIRVWSNVTLTEPVKVYDVLCPIIQSRDEATVESGSASVDMSRRASAPLQWNTQDSLRAYASHLVKSSSTNATVRREAPLSPSRMRTKVETKPVTAASGLLVVPASIPSTVKSDDQLSDTENTCGEAVEVLSRHSGKASYDITKDGEDVAVVTLVKTTYRLGETVLGVVTFNDPNAAHVLKFSAFLESHEIIPESLSPGPGQTQPPALSRLYAEHRSAYAVSFTRLSFSLEIPSDATPAFGLTAGDEGARGGLEWRVRLSFLVAIRSKRHGGKAVQLMPKSTTEDMNHRSFSACTTMIPVMPIQGDKLHELDTEMVECVIPVQVLAGNTEFVVRPSVWAI